MRMAALACGFSKPMNRWLAVKPGGGTMPTRELVGKTGSAANAVAIMPARMKAAETMRRAAVTKGMVDPVAGRRLRGANPAAHRIQGCKIGDNAAGCRDLLLGVEMF